MRPLVLPVAVLSLLCSVLLAEAVWFRSTKSVTFDETFYLSCGLQTVHDRWIDPRIAGEGVGPLPVLLNYVPPLLFVDRQKRPDPWEGQPEDRQLIVLPRLVNSVVAGAALVVLVFLWLLLRRGLAAATFGAGIVALSPTVVGHSSLATTDVSFAFFSLLALATLTWYLSAPSRLRLMALVVTTAAALTAKYSAVFLLPTIGIMFLIRELRYRPSSWRASFVPAVRTFAVFLCLLAPAWWGFHLFSFTGPLKNVPVEETPDSSPWVKLLGRGPLATRFMDVAHRELKRPAPVAGVLFQFLHNQSGHPAYLMGERSQTGWWHYFPCAFAVKSTPVELILTAGLLVGLAASWRRTGRLSSGSVARVAGATCPRSSERQETVTVWGMLPQLPRNRTEPLPKADGTDFGLQTLLLGAGIFLLMILTSKIAIGHRYLIVLYPLIAIVAADRLFAWSRRRLTIGVAAALLAGQAVSNAAIAPDFLAYFNRASGGPERGREWLVDSNLDWGQDLPALREVLAERDGGPVAISYFGTAHLKSYGVYADPIAALPRDPDDYTAFAVSVTHLQGVYVAGDDPFRAFRDFTPAAAAGYSIAVFDLDTPEKRAAFRDAAAKVRKGTVEREKNERKPEPPLGVSSPT